MTVMAEPVILDWGSDEKGSSDDESYDEPMYEVERILAERASRGAKQYLVKWAGFGEEECTWEPADSFDQGLSISLWEEARDRGDTLDEAELQDVENKMACHKEEKEGKEAAESKRRDQKISTDSSAGTNTIRKNSTDLPLPDARTNSIAKSEPTAGSQISSKPRPPRAVESAPKAGPATPRQEFHGVTDRPQTPRRTTTLQSITSSAPSRSPRNQEGKRYRNLSHQNNDQKRRRQEPAHNLGQLGTKLGLATELVHTPADDVALNLPSGPPRLPVARNTTHETFVESANGKFERLREVETAMPSSLTAQQSSRSLPLHDPNYSRDPEMRCFRWGGEEFYHTFGEAVVQVSFQGRVIGHVKVSGLPGHMVSALIKTKQGPQLRMQFKQEDAYDLEDFRAFARGNPSEVYAVGTIEPYDNARDEFYELLSHLNKHSNAAGVWRHALFPWVLIAYSSAAASFSEKHFPDFRGLLGLVACARVPWRKTTVVSDKALNVLAGTMPIGISDRDEAYGHGPTLTLDATSDKREKSSATDAVPALGNFKAASAEISDGKTDVPTTRNTTQTDPKGEISIDKQKDATKRKNEHDFEESDSVSYQYLTRIPANVKLTGSGNGTFNHHLARFFLAFGENQKNEEAELKAWLSARTPAYMVFSASEAHGWDRYKETMRYADHIGIILIHEDYMSEALGLMTGLAKRIRREDLQLFRVSLGGPLYDLSLRHFTRIFPSGLILAITEGWLIAHPESTAVILEWFAKNKKKNYKVFLRPLPERYLSEMCEDNTLSRGDIKSHRQSSLHLRRLRGAFETTASPVVSSDDERGSSSYILSPLSLSVYSKGENDASLFIKDDKKIAVRDEKLLDFFSGWSFSQLDRCRKFVALTDHVSERITKRSNHVDFLSKDFMAVYNIKKRGTSTECLVTPMSPVVNKSPVVE